MNTITIPLKYYNKLKTDAQRFKDLTALLYQDATLTANKENLYFSALSVSAYLKAVDLENFDNTLVYLKMKDEMGERNND